MSLDTPNGGPPSNDVSKTPLDTTSVFESFPPDLDYELVRLIGYGSYGEVWLVRDAAGNFRACKVVHRERFDNDRPYEREFAGIKKFEPVSRANESQVKILHVGRRDAAGYFYYIMELGDDANFGQQIRPERYVPKTIKSELQLKSRIPIDECVRIGLSLTTALENLHCNGLIHRDIKPANIIFVSGVPKLADIGLVTESNLTISYVGTEGYIPPEGPTSPQADIYGLGKVLYEMSSGRDRMDFPELPENFESFPDLEILLELNAVVTRACQRDIRKRYQTAQEMSADLAILNAGKSIRKARLAKQRFGLVMKTGIALAAVSFVTAGIFYHQKDKARIADSSQTKIVRGKIPVPDSKLVAKSEMEIRQAYKEQLATGNSSNKLAAAKELFQQSVFIDEPVLQIATLRVSASLFAEAGNYDLAMEACQKILERFLVNEIDLKLEVLNQSRTFAKTPANNAALSEICVATGFFAIALDDYERAEKLATLAKSAAQSSDDLRLAKQVQFLENEITRGKREFERVKIFAETLRGNPTGAKANLEMGKFFCFAKSDWETGLPMLARGSDSALKAIAENEIAKASESREQAGIGNQWWNLAEITSDSDKIDFRRRAKFWFLKAIANAKEPGKSELKQRLAEKIKAVPAQSAEVRISGRVDGTERIDIFADQIQWKTSRGSTGDKINHVVIGNLKRGQTKVLVNSGATRFLPDGIDFSTAKLTINHKAKKRGKVLLETVAEDHVRVQISDPPTGRSEFEVTVSFGD